MPDELDDVHNPLAEGEPVVAMNEYLCIDAPRVCILVLFNGRQKPVSEDRKAFQGFGNLV